MGTSNKGTIGVIGDVTNSDLSTDGYSSARAYALDCETSPPKLKTNSTTTSADEDLEMICLPGATAFVPALVVSGLPNHDFYFAGFLPQKKGRQTKLSHLKNEEKTFILYESPFRLIKLLTELKIQLGGNRNASVSREISKIYEENKKGTLSELLDYFSGKEVKGEIVVVVEGNKHHHG